MCLQGLQLNEEEHNSIAAAAQPGCAEMKPSVTAQTDLTHGGRTLGMPCNTSSLVATLVALTHPSNVEELPF